MRSHRGKSHAHATSRLALAALVAVSLQGCTTGGRGGEELPIEDLSLLVAGAQRTMTIETRAENVLIRDCMKQAGFEFFIESAAAVVPDVDGGSYALFVGQITEESASTTGYGPFVDSPFFAPNEPDPSKPSDVDDAAFNESSHARNNKYYEELSPEDQRAYLVAFEGDGDDTRVTLDDGVSIPNVGCLADASREVLGEERLDVILTFNEVQNLMGNLETEGDSDLVAASEDWRVCMLESGYDFETVPEAIAAGVALRGDAVQPTANEIDQAVADAFCQASSDLPGATQRAFDSEQRQVIEDNTDLLLAWQGLEVVILERSSRVLGFTYEPVS